MPNCFTLTRKGEVKPTPLAKIDEELVALMNARGFPAELHPVKYCHGWFDIIGFGLACEKTWDDLRKAETDYAAEYPGYNPQPYLVMIDYLEANFEPNCWVEIGRR